MWYNLITITHCYPVCLGATNAAGNAVVCSKAMTRTKSWWWLRAHHVLTLCYFNDWNASFHCVMFSWICSLWFVSRMSSQGLFTIWIGKGPVWTHCDVPADLCQINQTISSAHLDTRECNCLSHRAHHFSACWPEAYLSYNYLIVQLMFCFQMKPKQMLPQQLSWLWRHLCYGESISALWSASGADTSLLHFHLEGFYQAHTHKHIMIHVTMMTGDYSDSDS